MNANCSVCAKSFPLEKGAKSITCPYCYTDFALRGGKLVVIDDENLAPAPSVAGKPAARKKAGGRGTAAALEFADEVGAKGKVKKKKRPSSERAATANGKGSASQGAKRQSSGGKKKSKPGRTFEDEMAAIAEAEQDNQKGFARVVVIATVLLLLGGGIGAYLILNDYFTRRSENPLLTPTTHNDAANGGSATAAGNGGGGHAELESTLDEAGPRVPAAELIAQFQAEFEQPSVVGMQRVARQAEAALAESRLERRQQGRLRALGLRAQQALKALMALQQVEAHLAALARAESAEREAFELYFAQEAIRLAQREVSGRDEELAATRALAEALHEQVREHQRRLAHAE